MCIRDRKKPLISRLLTGSKKLKIAFIYAKTPGSSAWTYAHELGRLHLEQMFPEEVTTVCYENIVPELAEKAITDAIQKLSLIHISSGESSCGRSYRSCHSYR